MNILYKQILVHKNLICSKKKKCVFNVFFFIESPNLTIENDVWFFVRFPIREKSSQYDF